MKRLRAIIVSGMAMTGTWIFAPWSLAADAPVKTTATESTIATLEDDPDIELASRLERAFKKLAKKIEPSVVSLRVRVRPGNWLEELRHMNEQLGGSSSDESQGSGVIFESSGLIITNEHVVRSAQSIRVTLMDGSDYAAEICGTDARSDLAMVRIVSNETPLNLPRAELADSDKVEVGQYALAVGNPFGLNNTFTMGVVSARKRNMSVRNLSSDVFYGNLIQTDAAINPGNSGGPLFDLRGKLIGINTMIFTKTGISQGFGFAIPSNHLQKRLAYLKDGREIEYGWLGLQLDDFRPGQKLFKVPENKGVLINAVLPNTPADRAGLQQGMVILNFDSLRVTNAAELIALVNETPVGYTAKLKVIDRAGKPAEISVRISKRYAEQVRATLQGLDDNEAIALDTDLDAPPKAAALPSDPSTADTGTADANSTKPPQPSLSVTPADRVTAVAKNTFQWRGMQLKEIEPAAAAKRGGHIEIVRVKKGSPADHANLYEGAVLTELKHVAAPAIQKLKSIRDFKRSVKALDGPVSLYVLLDGYVSVDGEKKE